MKSFFRSFFATLFAMLIVFLILACFIAVKTNEQPDVKDHSYLVIDINGDIPEYSLAAGLMSKMMGGSTESLTRILCNLEKVAVDDRIDGVLLKVSEGNSAGYAKLEEIRGAIEAVRAAGKPVYSFSDNLGRKALYLAAACDSIYIRRLI